MSRTRGFVAIALLGAFFAIHVTGCSLIGLGAGAAWDATHKHVHTLPPTRFVRFYPGDKMTLTLDDGSLVDGVYRGAVRMPEDEYRARYQAWRASDPRGAEFPRIGEFVSIGEPSSLFLVGEGSFVGIAHNGVETEQRGKIRNAPFDAKGYVFRADGRPLSLSRLRATVDAGNVPMTTAMRLETSEGDRVTPVDRVVLVTAPGHGHGARNGFVVGLVADVVVVGTAATSFSQEPLMGSSGCESTSFGPY